MARKRDKAGYTTTENRDDVRTGRQSMSPLFRRTPPEVDAKALLALGQAYDAMGKDQEAFVVYERLVRQYGNSRNEESRRAVASGLVFKAAALGSRGRFEEAIAAADDCMHRYGTDPSLRNQTCVALTSKCAGLISLLRLKEAVTLCDDILREYSGDTAPVICQALEKVRGYRIKAITDEAEVSGQEALMTFAKSLRGLQSQPSDKEVLAACDEVVKCYSSATEPELRLAAALALMKKGAALSGAGHMQEAAGALATLVVQFGRDADPRVLDLVKSAKKVLGSTGEKREAE